MKLGIEGNDRTEVLDGVSEGDRVVTTGAAPTSQVSVIAETDSGAKIEPAIEPGLSGSNGSDAVGSGSAVGSATAATSG